MSQQDRKKLLKDLLKIDVNDQKFVNLPIQLKKKIYQYVIPRENTNLQQELQQIQKKKWLKTAKQYIKQKYTQAYSKKKYNYQWFLQIIAYILFLDRTVDNLFSKKKLEFKILSNDNNGLEIYVSILKKDNKIKLVIKRDLFTHHPNPESHLDEFNAKQCEIEFIQRSKYGPPYSLLKILFVLLHKYKFPLEYNGENNLLEIMIGYLHNIFKESYDFKKDIFIKGDYPEELELLQGFLDYPIYLKKIKETELKKPQKEFIKCLKKILKMESFHRQKFDLIDIEDFFNRYEESDDDY